MKSNWINETQIRSTNHERICQIESKTYSYLKDKNNKDEKAKGAKKCVITELEDCKNCLEAAQFENKINHLEKNKIDADSLKEDQKDFIKINKLVLKTQQKFRSEKHNVFNEEISKIALSSNYDKRIQSIDSIQTYAKGTSKDLICNNEEIKCSNIIKQYKNI